MFNVNDVVPIGTVIARIKTEAAEEVTEQPKKPVEMIHMQEERRKSENHQDTMQGGMKSKKYAISNFPRASNFKLPGIRC